MAHSASAKKRIRQNEKRRARNRWRKAKIRDAVKAFDQAVHDGDAGQAQQALQVCYKTLDQVAAKGSIHKNAAARKKSRLSKRLKAMSDASA